jgi:hypothetical protein
MKLDTRRVVLASLDALRRWEGDLELERAVLELETDGISTADARRREGAGNDDSEGGTRPAPRFGDAVSMTGDSGRATESAVGGPFLLRFGVSVIFVVMSEGNKGLSGVGVFDEKRLLEETGTLKLGVEGVVRRGLGGKG